MLEVITTVRKERSGPVYHDLDDLAGSWSREEAAAFDEVLQEQRTIQNIEDFCVDRDFRP